MTEERPFMPHTISEEGLALIKRFEGFAAKPYLCPAGKWTVGYGHVLAPQSVIPAPERGSRVTNTGLTNNPRSPRKTGMTEEEAEILLLQDLAPVESAINRLVTVPLSQNQFDALCSLVYNIGVGAFARSTLLRLLSSRAHADRHGTDTEPSHARELDTGLRRYDEVSDQFLRWIYAGGKPLPGLKNRRRAEKDLFDSKITLPP